MDKTIMYEKLSKKFFLGLPDGVFLVSNTMLAPGQPMFAQAVKPPNQRADQWQEIVAARVNGRKCMVFKSAKDFMTTVLEVPFHREHN